MTTHSPLCLSSSSSSSHPLRTLSRNAPWIPHHHHHSSSSCRSFPLSSSSFQQTNRRCEDFKMIRRPRPQKSERGPVKTLETQEHNCSCCFPASLDSSSSSSFYQQHNQNRCCSFLSSTSSSSSFTPPLFSARKSSPCHSPFLESHRKSRKNKRDQHLLLSSSSSSCCSSPCRGRRNDSELYHGNVSVLGNEGSSEGHSLMNVSLICPEPCDVCTRKDKISPLDGCISWNLPSQSR